MGYKGGFWRASKKNLFLGVGASYMDVFTLLKCIKLYNYDLCKFLLTHVTLQKSLLKEFPGGAAG